MADIRLIPLDHVTIMKLKFIKTFIFLKHIHRQTKTIKNIPTLLKLGMPQMHLPTGIKYRLICLMFKVYLDLNGFLAL